MKKISYIALAGVIAASGFAMPALAASNAAAAVSSGSVPFCSSATADRELKDGVYANELGKKGLNIDSVEIWNGCVKVLYSSTSGGGSSMAIYDPDTLQLLQSSGSLG